MLDPSASFTGVSCAAQSSAGERGAVEAGDVPFGEVFGAHREFAGGVEPAFRARRFGADGAEREAAIALRVGLAYRLVLVERADV
ncbi:hypothetical protein NHF48_005995 [Sphingomonas sp. H160509]|nr:hypothetical protein [Sphingomonas sp. H160509]MDD1450632.1 hypothetical protein [Sphingomonas sp. H160509]